jgi:hypothetical protein
MSDDIDVSNYRDEYIPYTSDAPRRSTRQRSVFHPYIPEKTPRMRVEKEPTKTRVERKRTGGRSIPRDYEHYETDDVPQAPKFTELRANVIHNAFAGGITRIPLISEVMKIGNDVIEMRWKEIHLIQDAIGMLRKKGIDEDLIIKLQTHLAALEWEMNRKNVMESDLPPLGPETTNFADISTWLIFYYELLHENKHRITDVKYSFTMLSKTEKKSLDKYEKMAEEVMMQFEEHARSFKLEGQSRHVYKTVTDEIRKNCEACR